MKDPVAPHILVVDDSETARAMTMEVLTSIGFSQKMSDAINGREAVDVLMRYQSSSPVTLILLDWHMPVMNGLDLIHFVRKGLGRPQPKILLVTAEANASNLLEGIKAGADGYLLKPFDEATLKNAIRKAIEAAQLKLG